jgi:hypothetical protein
MGVNSESAVAECEELSLLDLPPELILEEIAKWVGSREGIVRLAACCKCLREILLGSKYARAKFEALPWILTYSTSFDTDHLPINDGLEVFPYVLDVSHLTWVKAEKLEGMMASVGEAEPGEHSRWHVKSFPAVYSGKARPIIGSILKGIGFERALETRRSMAEDLIAHGGWWRNSNTGELINPRDLEADPFTDEEVEFIRAWADLPLDLWKKCYAHRRMPRFLERALKGEAPDSDMAWQAIFRLGRIDSALKAKPGSGAVHPGTFSPFAMFQCPNKNNPLGGGQLIRW